MKLVRIGVLLGLALLIVGGVMAAAANERQAPPGGVLVSTPEGNTAIHILPAQGIVFLMPNLPASFQVCTEFTNGGYRNCRYISELRVPK